MAPQESKIISRSPAFLPNYRFTLVCFLCPCQTWFPGYLEHNTSIVVACHFDARLELCALFSCLLRSPSGNSTWRNPEKSHQAIPPHDPWRRSRQPRPRHHACSSSRRPFRRIRSCSTHISSRRGYRNPVSPLMVHRPGS